MLSLRDFEEGQTMPKELSDAYCNFMQRTLEHAMSHGVPVPPIYILRKDTNRGAEHAITHTPDMFVESGYTVMLVDTFV